MELLEAFTLLGGKYPGQKVLAKECFERKKRDSNRNKKSRDVVLNNLKIVESTRSAVYKGVETRAEKVNIIKYIIFQDCEPWSIA